MIGHRPGTPQPGGLFGHPQTPPQNSHLCVVAYERCIDDGCRRNRVPRRTHFGTIACILAPGPPGGAWVPGAGETPPAENSILQVSPCWTPNGLSEMWHHVRLMLKVYYTPPDEVVRVSKKSPSQRGFRPVMLNQSAYDGLMGYAKGEGGLSASAAVQRLLSGRGGGGAIDLEALFLACRVDGKTAQRIREWLGN